MLKSIEPGSFFCLFSKRHKDLYHELRSQLIGGLSIVFTRLALSDKTPYAPTSFPTPRQSVVQEDSMLTVCICMPYKNPTLASTLSRIRIQITLDQTLV